MLTDSMERRGTSGARHQRSASNTLCATELSTARVDTRIGQDFVGPLVILPSHQLSMHIRTV